MALMAVSHGDFSLVFWVAVLPAVTCVLLVAFGVEELETTRPVAKAQFPIRRASLARLDRRFWWMIAFAALLPWRASPKPFCSCALKTWGLLQPR